MILAELGVGGSHGAVWNWVCRLDDSVSDPPSASPTRVTVDETAVKIDGEWSWLWAAIYFDTKLILDVQLFGRRGTDLAAAFLHGLHEKHNLTKTVFLVDQFGYRATLARLGLNGRDDYTDRNFIGK